MKIVFMGTPDFAVPTLNALVDAGHEVGLVVTQPDRAGNRGKITFSPVKQAALACGIEVLQPQRLNRDEQAVSRIREYAPDVMVVVAFGQILSQEVLDIPRLCCLNVHGSLLPVLRGAAPMQQSILLGHDKTGVTIMRMDAGLDTGDMIARAETVIGRKNFEQIHDELAEMGAALLVETLPKLERGEVDFVKQDDAEATYAARLTREDGRIDFRCSAKEIDQKIRAFDPWPGAFCELDGKTLKFWNAEPLETETGAEPGTVLAADKDGITVACGSGALRVTVVQLAGKKRMAAGDFLRGHKIEQGAILN